MQYLNKTFRVGMFANNKEIKCEVCGKEGKTYVQKGEKFTCTECAKKEKENQAA